ncbi:hypothetical protein QCA50_000521 [Cerrena zonata]|uniref:Alpha/beta-hydrolase n=1 Tax=Cerrena zonata TaxID=2478898 RepID=A0AAW0GY29_9APHY
MEPKVKDITDVLHPPRRRTLSFYLVLLIAVLPIWSIVPGAWAFVIYSLHSGSIWTFSWRGQSLFAFALCEVFFSVHHYNLSRFIGSTSPNGSGNLTELQAAFRRVLKAGLASLPDDGSDDEEVGNRPGSPAEDIIALEYNDPRAVDFRNYLRTWFRKAPWSSIHRQEVYSWLYWSIFNAKFTTLESLPEPRRKIVLEVLDMLEKRAGVAIPEGTNPASSPLLLTLDPINVAWRPFVWYAGVAISNAILRRRFQSKWNAKIGTFNGLEYILRVPRSWSPKTGPRPIVFLHGLGLGLTQYKMFLSHLLNAVPDTPVLVPLHPHVSQEIFHPRFLKPMSRHESADTLAGLICELGWATMKKDGTTSGEDSEVEKLKNEVRPTGVTMISHSNGSFTHAWMLKAYPEMIKRSCFVDPVTFCSWEGDLCYNFVYRPCATGIELIMKYFVGTELGVANFLQRHFDWSSNCLWYEEIPHAKDPAKARFFLGGKDDIVDAARVKRYLTSHGIKKGLWFDPDGRHGQALLAGGEGHKEILRWLREA